jgi:hypothetical protein
LEPFLSIPGSWSVLAAAKSALDSGSDRTDLIAYGLFALCAIALVIVFLLWFYGMPKRSRELALAQPAEGASVSLDDVNINAELVIALLRAASPNEVLKWIDGDPASHTLGQLNQFLTLLRRPYENDLRGAAADGNTYLALARSHVTMAALVDDVEQLCTRLHTLESNAITHERVSITATKTTFTVVALLCAFGGTLIGGIKLL